MNFDIDWALLGPELILAGTVLVLLVLDILMPRARHLFQAVASLGGLATIAWILRVPPDWAAGTTFNGMLADDAVTRGFGLVVALALTLVLATGEADIEGHDVGHHRGEYYMLMVSAALGMFLMIAATNLIMVFLGLELFSLALYLLCIFFPRENPSQEAGLKYFILSSLASAVMLYGMALLYGACGSTWLREIIMASPNPDLKFLQLLGLLLVLCGLGFKLSAVPFHMWSPDVYQGAPTSVTSFMSVATKAAALGALWRLTPLGDRPNALLQAGQQPAPMVESGELIAALCVLSILVGNFLALPQTQLKRLLACSGIAQAGYLLIAAHGASERGAAALVFFMIVYAFMNVGAFTGVLWLERIYGRAVSVDDLSGLANRNPGLAAALALCFISLAGLPPAGGFLGKLYLFGAGASSGSLALVVVGAVGSLLGAYYYLNPVARMYMREPASEPRHVAPPALLVLVMVVCVVGILATGLMPQPFLDWATRVGAEMNAHVRF